MNITLEKLAKIAGVSLGTVSKAFSESDEISKETKEKIFAIAKEYNCFDKYYKAKKARKVVAVICPELKGDYYNSIVSRIEQELNRRNIIMFLAISNFEAKKEESIIKYLTSSKTVDGVIVISAKSKIKFDKDLPIVALHTRRTDSEVDCINVDFDEAISDGIKYLKNCGHTKIGFISETLTKGKLESFIKCAKKLNVSLRKEWIVEENERFEKAGNTGAEKLLNLKDKPTAIFCSYDNIALGAIDTIKKHGLSVPEDFSIIGFDDIAVASHVNIGLTTIKTNNDAICDLAVDLIVKKIKSKFYALHQQITMRAELVIRNSVKKLN